MLFFHRVDESMSRFQSPCTVDACRAPTAVPLGLLTNPADQEVTEYKIEFNLQKKEAPEFSGTLIMEFSEVRNSSHFWRKLKK